MSSKGTGNNEQSIHSSVSDNVNFDLIIHMNNLLEYFCVKNALAYFIKLMTYRMKTWNTGSMTDRFACCADLQQRRQIRKEPS